MAGKGGSMPPHERPRMVVTRLLLQSLARTCRSQLVAAWSAAISRYAARWQSCFFGDGTTNIVPYHEALNLAGRFWKIGRSCSVCENKPVLGELHTDRCGSRRFEHPAADRGGPAYGLESIIVDGETTLDAVYAVAMRTLKRARAGQWTFASRGQDV